VIASPARGIVHASAGTLLAERRADSTGDHARHRSGAAHLHQRHDRAAEGRADAALVLLGNLPGFSYSHDEFPQTGDLFWSPADWAWTGGLMDALMPTLYHGYPILGYRGRFDPEKAFALIEKYQVTSSFLFPTALKMMMKAVPDRARATTSAALDHERRRERWAPRCSSGRASIWASRSTRCSGRPR
jgi:acyl-CoA synthetase (AMP-forming)/AMP-acid ligase II